MTPAVPPAPDELVVTIGEQVAAAGGVAATALNRTSMATAARRDQVRMEKWGFSTSYLPFIMLFLGLVDVICVLRRFRRHRFRIHPHRRERVE